MALKLRAYLRLLCVVLLLGVCSGQRSEPLQLFQFTFSDLNELHITLNNSLIDLLQRYRAANALMIEMDSRNRENYYYTCLFELHASTATNNTTSGVAPWSCSKEGAYAKVY